MLGKGCPQSRWVHVILPLGLGASLVVRGPGATQFSQPRKRRQGQEPLAVTARLGLDSVCIMASRCQENPLIQLGSWLPMCHVQFTLGVLEHIYSAWGGPLLLLEPVGL